MSAGPRRGGETLKDWVRRTARDEFHERYQRAISRRKFTGNDRVADARLALYDIAEDISESVMAACIVYVVETLETDDEREYLIGRLEARKRDTEAIQREHTE